VKIMDTISEQYAARGHVLLSVTEDADGARWVAVCTRPNICGERPESEHGCPFPAGTIIPGEGIKKGRGRGQR
jgi:hypothetical protein